MPNDPPRLPATRGDISPEMRAMLLEWQRALLTQANGIRTMLGLPPARAERDSKDGRGRD